jgi:hypothetical protein
MESITVEKPTLRMVNSEEIRTVEEWEELYPELWLLIAVTDEDFSRVHSGKLVATAADPVELIEPRRARRNRGVVNLTTKGVARGVQPALSTRL